MEFTAKTITTRKIKSNYISEKQTNGDINHNTDFNSTTNLSPGGTSALF
jgi:hypothetical protein